MAAMTQDQLTDAARICMHAKAKADPRYWVLVQTLAQRLGYQAIDVEIRIQLMAKGVHI